MRHHVHTLTSTKPKLVQKYHKPDNYKSQQIKHIFIPLQWPFALPSAPSTMGKRQQSIQQSTHSERGRNYS